MLNRNAVTLIKGIKVCQPTLNEQELKQSLNPYWAKIWHSALAICNYIEQNTNCVKSKRIVELGAGLGLPSLLVSKISSNVLATDISGLATNYIQQSIALNQLINISTAVLDWNELLNEQCFNEYHNQFDVMMLSDVNYEPIQFKALSELFIKWVAAGKTILLASPQRLIAKDFIIQIAPLISNQFEYEIDYAQDVKLISVFELG